jgi:hypothetical protein
MYQPISDPEQEHKRVTTDNTKRKTVQTQTYQSHHATNHHPKGGGGGGTKRSFIKKNKPSNQIRRKKKQRTRSNTKQQNLKSTELEPPHPSNSDEAE